MHLCSPTNCLLRRVFPPLYAKENKTYQEDKVVFKKIDTALTETEV